jgi:hypothetical protein
MQVCHKHCPPEGGAASGLILAVAAGAAVLAVVSFVLTHLWLILGCAAALAVGAAGALLALRGALNRAARGTVGASPEIADRLRLRGVPAQLVSAAQPALPPAQQWRVVSVEKVPERVVQGRVLPAGEKMPG